MTVETETLPEEPITRRREPRPEETVRSENRPPSSEPRRDRAPRSGFSRRPLWIGLALVAVVALVVWLRADRGATGPAQRGPQATPVRVAEVVRGELDVLSTYPGELVGEVADIAPQVTGLLEEVPVRIGDRVERGDVVAVIEDLNLRNQLQESQGQLGAARANIRRAEAELQREEAELRRAEELYNQDLLSEQEYERVRSAVATARASLAATEAQREQAEARVALLERQLRETRVEAPFDGIVAARYLDRGAFVQQATPILRLVEAETPRVQFRVPERDLASVRPGAAIDVGTQATGSQSFPGRVRSLSGEISRTDRTVTVEGELLEADPDLLKPGMYAQVTVRLQQLDDAVLIPDAAILQRVGMDGREEVGVFVAEGETARWVPIEVQGRSRGRAAVTGDLPVGAEVLTLGHAQLRDGAEIRIVQRTGDTTAADGEVSR